MSRPYFSKSIEDLEVAFNQRQSDPDFLKALIAELSKRTTKRARQLAESAIRATEEIAKSGGASSGPGTSPTTARKQEAEAPKRDQWSEDLGLGSDNSQAVVETASATGTSDL